MTDDLVTWLGARLDEDAGDNRVHDLDCNLSLSAGFHGPCDCGWPARLRREVEAKRRILDSHVPQSVTAFDPDGWEHTGDMCGNHDQMEEWPCPAVRLLALPYADRPGYREEWKP